MTSMKKSLAMMLALILILAGCASPSGQEKESTTTKTPAAHKDELVYVARDINSTLDPTKPQSDGYLRRVGALEALFKANAKGEIIPQLAKRAQELDDHTWQVDLRENAKFWSGKPVTSDVVIASLERSKKENSSYETALRGLKISPKDDYTLLIQTDESHVDVPLRLISVSIANPELDFSSVD